MRKSKFAEKRFNTESTGVGASLRRQAQRSQRRRRVAQPSAFGIAKRAVFDQRPLAKTARGKRWGRTGSARLKSCPDTDGRKAAASLPAAGTPPHSKVAAVSGAGPQVPERHVTCYGLDA